MIASRTDRPRAFMHPATVGLTIALLAASFVSMPQSASAAVESGEALYLSSTSGGSVDGISFRDEDIVARNHDTGEWSLFFDGTAAGLESSVDVDAFAFTEPGEPTESDLLLSFSRPADVPGLGVVDDSDIVRYDQSAASFALELIGAAVGLTTSAEDIDAISLDDGDLVLSTRGTARVPRSGGGTLKVRDEDLAVLRSGTFERLFDGGDVQLGQQDVRAAHVGSPDGSQRLAFAATGGSSDPDDVTEFTGALGNDTVGVLTLVFDGDSDGFGSEQVDGLAIAVAVDTAPFDECVVPAGGATGVVDFANLRNSFDVADFNVDANPTPIRAVFDADRDRMRFGPEGLQLAVDVAGNDPLDYRDRAELREKPIGNVIASGTTHAYCMRFRVRELPRLFGPVTIFQRFDPDPMVQGPDIEVELAGMNQFGDPVRNELQVVSWDGRHRTGRRLSTTNTLLVVVHTHPTQGSFKVLHNGRLLREASGMDTTGPPEGSWFQFGIYPHGLHEGQNRADQIASGETSVHFEYADLRVVEFANGPSDLSGFDVIDG